MHNLDSKSDHSCCTDHCANNHEYRRVTERELGDWEKKITELKEKVKDKSADIKADFDNAISGLEKDRANFSDYLAELGDKAEDKWDDFKDEAEAKWKTLAGSFDDFVKKYT